VAFESFSDFLAMGTHGHYVWSVYGISLFLLVGITVQSITAKKSQIKRLRKLSLGKQNTHAPD